MLVTDKQYYMEKKLVEKCETYVGRQEQKFDHLIILDGEEGYGKTTCAVHLCYYLAHLTGKSFTTENIFFDPEKMMEHASKTRKQIIMWDEAAFGAMGSQWQNKTQQKLVMCMMTARKMGHFWVFLIPEVDKLKDYFIRRACALIHIYSPDDIHRGKYVFFNKKKKNLIRNTIKRRKEVSYKDYSFRAEFKDVLANLIDEDLYEAAKDKAIMDAFKEDEVNNPYKVKYEDLKFKIGGLYDYLKDKYGISQAEIGKVLKTNRMFISRCKKIPLLPSDRVQVDL